MAGEYASLGLYPKGHLMAKLRPSLGKHVLTSAQVNELADGTRVTVAGLIIRRQRPLSKAVFITLEDEFGHIPMMVWPKTYARYRLVLREPLVLAGGFVSRRDGTMNIMLTHAKPLPGAPPVVPQALGHQQESFSNLQFVPPTDIFTRMEPRIAGVSTLGISTPGRPLR